MIAYDSTKLRNRAVREKGDELLKRKFISETQRDAIDEKFPEDLYSPNIFIRIGLFLFASFAISSAGGFFGFMSVLLGVDSEAYAIACLILGAGLCIFAVEKLIPDRKLFASGIEEALLYHAWGSLFGGLMFMGDQIGLRDENMFLMALIVITPLTAWAAVRYLDTILSLAATICAFIIVFILLKKTGDAARYIIPFAFMMLSAFKYLRLHNMRLDPEKFYWKNCLMVTEGLLLLIFYFSGNYFVIRETAVEFFGMDPESDLPLGWFFWAFTFLVPVGYIYWGLKKKDKIPMWAGLILIGVTVQTFRHYYSVAPPEVALSIAGVAMIVLAWFSIRYFKKEQHGITYEADEGGDDFLKSHAEAFIIAQTLSQSTVIKKDDSIGPGGGDFGGGGSESKY